MKRTSSSLLLALAVSLLAGCAASSDSGAVDFAVTVPQSLASSIARVKVTVSAADITSFSVDLVATNGNWGGQVGNIPAGANRSFLAEAFDSSGTKIFEGTASKSIAADESPLVVITLQKLNPAPAFENAAPAIGSLSVSSTSVITGGSISLIAAASDPNTGDTLTYAWTSTAGTFSAASAATSSWTAPATTGLQTLTLTVTDQGGLSNRVSLNVNVVRAGGQGSAQLDVRFNTSPIVASVSVSASQLDALQTTSVTASASDVDSDTLTYYWDTACVGTWTNRSSSTAQFTPTERPGGTCNNCNLTVKVDDGHGGINTGTVALCVSKPADPGHVSPVIVHTYRSADTATASQALTYEVVASDPENSALTFSWATTTGTLGTAANTATSSRLTWTAPACVPASTPVTITATVTNAFGKSTPQSFTVSGVPSC